MSCAARKRRWRKQKDRRLDAKSTHLAMGIQPTRLHSLGTRFCAKTRADRTLSPPRGWREISPYLAWLERPPLPEAEFILWRRATNPSPTEDVHRRPNIHTLEQR